MSRAASPRRITAQGLACATIFVLRVRAVDAAGHVSRDSPVARARTRACTDHVAPAAPANVRAITVADTSVALAWDPARRPGRHRAPLRGLPQRRAARAARTAPASSARSLAPATPYRFTVAAIDGGGHRSPEGALDTATQAPLPATGPAYAYMLATTGTSFEDMQRHYRQIAVVSPTYY